MQRERLFLLDIVEAAEAVSRFLDGVDEKAFHASELIQSAVLQKLTVIGEAAARLPQEVRERHPDVEWRDIVGFRNIAVHAYFNVDWSIVWTTATEDAPSLRERVGTILAEIESGGPGRVY